MVTTQAFLPFRNPNASIVGINANMISLPVASVPAAGASAYNCSKVAQAKLLEYVAAEHEDVFVASVHPGCVESDMLTQSGIDVPPEWLDDGRVSSLLFLFLLLLTRSFIYTSFPSHP